MATNLETQRNYENPLEDVYSELSNLNQEVKENNDRIPEKEKEEYMKLNKKFYNLIGRVRSNKLSTKDRFILIGNKVPFIDYSNAYPKELIIWKKTFGYTGIRLKRYENDGVNQKRPELRAENHLFIGLYHNKGELNTMQYRTLLEKMEQILDNQEKILKEKQKEGDDKKTQEIDDFITNI